MELAKNLFFAPLMNLMVTFGEPANSMSLSKVKEYYSPQRLLNLSSSQEFLDVIKVFAASLPQDTSRCMENPTTFVCDEGRGVEKLEEVVYDKFPGDPN
ncbi:MAG: hypothetical protein N2578_10235, partial [Bdellovibrionaceae bacterium]|nr:hypothetical protein [Pseudobdellovibrionaceae bacterium]